MTPRMKNPAEVLGVTPTIRAMMAPIYGSGLDRKLLGLVSLRVGQINECALCIGESLATGGDDRLDLVLDWRAQDCFTAAERVALDLAEAVTRLQARYDSVPDALWQQVEATFDEAQRAGLVLMIAAMNMFTRMNVSTRQVSADWAA